MLESNAPVAAIMSVEKTNHGEPAPAQNVPGQKTNVTFAEVLTDEHSANVVQMGETFDQLQLQQDISPTNADIGALVLENDAHLSSEDTHSNVTLTKPEAPVEPDTALHIVGHHAGTAEANPHDVSKSVQTPATTDANVTARIAPTAPQTIDAAPLGTKGQEIGMLAARPLVEAQRNTSFGNATSLETKKTVGEGQTTVLSDARISQAPLDQRQKSTKLDREFAEPKGVDQSQDAPKPRSIAELTYVSKQSPIGPSAQAVDFQKLTVVHVGETFAQPGLTEDSVEISSISRTETASVPTRADTTPQMARHVSQQVAYAIAQNTPGTTEIKLSPEELGRVRMTIQAVEGVVTIAVVAERVETGDLMRRHAVILQDDLANLGFDTINLAFSNEGQHTSPDASEPIPSSIDGTVEASDEQDEKVGPIGPNVDHGPRSGLDIRL